MKVLVQILLVTCWFGVALSQIRNGRNGRNNGRGNFPSNGRSGRNNGRGNFPSLVARNNGQRNVQNQRVDMNLVRGVAETSTPPVATAVRVPNPQQMLRLQKSVGKPAPAKSFVTQSSNRATQRQITTQATQQPQAFASERKPVNRQASTLQQKNDSRSNFNNQINEEDVNSEFTTGVFTTVTPFQRARPRVWDCYSLSGRLRSIIGRIPVHRVCW